MTLIKGKLLAECDKCGYGRFNFGFLNTVTDVMRSRNPSGRWETPGGCYGKISGGLLRSVCSGPPSAPSTEFNAIESSGLFDFFWYRNAVLDSNGVTRDRQWDKREPVYANATANKPLVNPFVSKVKVFELGKTGLLIEQWTHIYYSPLDEPGVPSGHHSDILLLPACKDGFYRDWKHDGVCVASGEE